MEHPKNFWEQFPIEIILDEIAREKKREAPREQLQIPIPPYFEINNDDEIEEDIIVIKLSQK
jgi:hypothetical protein